MWEWLEHYLELPDSASGTGTSWRVVWDRPWAGWLPDWAGWLTIALLCGVTLATLLRDARKLSRARQSVLFALRLAALALVIVFLCRPVLSVNRTVEPVIAILIDTSQSMSLQDEYSDPGVAELLGSTNGAREATRLNLARGVLTRDNGAFLRQLLKTHKLRVYQFAENATLLPGGEVTSAAQIPALLEALATLEANGRRTLPGHAVRQVLTEMKGRPPASLIVFSDGIATRGGDGQTIRLTQAVELARQSRTAVWTVGVGTEQAARDLELVDVQVPEYAYRLDPLEFDCVIRSTGYEPGPAKLRLLLEQTGTPLVELDVTLPESGKTQREKLIWQPDRAGDLVFAIEIERREDDVDPANNRLIRKVRVRESPLKVLLAERTPRYEYRYLKEFLEREPSVALSTVLLDGDLQAALQDRSGQTFGGRFPVREDQIKEFDAIVLGDVSPQDLGPGVLQLLQQYVSRDGGALIAIAGRRHNPRSYRGTPLADVFPVRLDPPPFIPPARWRTGGFHPRPTLAGLKGTPAFRGLDEAAEAGESLWEELPGWYRYEAFPDIKPGAVVWLTTEPVADDQPELPLVIEQRFGAGKVLFFATDEIWRLRFLAGDRYYGQFWLQTLRHLTRGRSEADNAELTTDRLTYERGDAIELRLRWPDASGVAARRPPLVRLTGPESLDVPLAPDPDHRELFSAEARNLPEGEYRAQWRSDDNAAVVATQFRIVAPLEETRQRNLDEAELRKTADDTGGRYTSIAQAAGVAERIPPGPVLTLEALATKPLWNRWELLVLLLALLSAEWVLRKRSQLA